MTTTPTLADLVAEYREAKAAQKRTRLGSDADYKAFKRIAEIFDRARAAGLLPDLLNEVNA